MVADAFLAAAIMALVVAVFWPATTRGRWHGDEPHKISETYFLRLILRRDFRNPAWTADIVSRSNPQIGKIIFGLAILAGGDSLPDDLSIQNELFTSNFQTSEATRLANLGRLRSTRRVSVMATAIAAAALFLLVSRLSGQIGGVIASLLFCRHFVVSAQATTAVFDAMMTCTTILTICAAVATLRASGRRRIALAVLTGILAAMTFQMRLSGLVAFGAAGVILIAGVSSRAVLRRAAIDIAIVTATLIATSVASNPYYWPNPPGRFVTQLHDLGVLLTGHPAEIHSWNERAHFEERTLAAGVAGKALLGGAVAMLVLVVARWKRVDRAERAVVVACWSLAMVVIVWLPVQWARYLEPVFAAFAICSGLAINELVRHMRDSVLRSPVRPPAT